MGTVSSVLNPEVNSPAEVAQLAKAFLRRTGMATGDFAHRIGYNVNTVTQFLNNQYARGKASRRKAICETILQFIETAQIDTDAEFHGKLYEVGNVRAMRDVFTRLCEKPCILLAYAPPGSGKTDVARALIPQFRRDNVDIFRIYCRAAISRRDLIHRIAVACRSLADISIERTITNLRYEFAGRRVVLYLDEAQHLSIDCLETVRELYDELHWSLCFAGSHQLDKVFTTWAGDLEQLERRITDKVELPTVTPEEAEQIVHSELPSFTPAKARTLIERSYTELKSRQRYLSIGRVMANIREIQELIPEASDPQPITLNTTPEDAA